MSDEPPLEIIKLPDPVGDESRDERAHQRDESRRRYRDHLTAMLTTIDTTRASPTTLADAILDTLFVDAARADGEMLLAATIADRLGFRVLASECRDTRHGVQIR